MFEATEPGDAGGLFLTTFGDARQTLKRMAASGKFSEVVAHIAPFDNSHAYPVQRLMPVVGEHARWVQAEVASKYPNTKILLSAFCEHNWPAPVMRPVFAEMRRLCPDCLMSNSIWKGEEVEGTITEVHVTSSKALPRKPRNEYTVSFDGFGGDGSGDMPDANVPKIAAHFGDARHIRYWNFRLNLKYGHKDKTPIPQRRVVPDVNYLKGHRALLKVREGAVTWGPNAGVFKPFADDHGGGADTKDNKAMAILPGVNREFINVMNLNGKVIDLMKRVMPDHTNEPKGPRYYSSRAAYQIGDLAAAGAGSRQIRIANMPATDADLRSSRFK